MLAELLTTASLTLGLTAGGYASLLRARLHIDPLTGLGNRATLTRLSRRHPDHELAGLLLLDLDQFKAINDTHGHRAGDAVLTEFAAHLRHLARPGERAIRLHGDEFVLWLGRLTDVHDAEHRAIELRDQVTTPLDVDGQRLQLTCSIGAAVDLGGRLQPLLSHADSRMYALKRQRGHLPSLPTPPTRRRRREARKDVA